MTLPALLALVLTLASPTSIDRLWETASQEPNSLAFERLATIIEMNIEIRDLALRHTGERNLNQQVLRSLSSIISSRLSSTTLQRGIRQLQNSDEIVQQMGLQILSEALNTSPETTSEPLERLALKGFYQTELSECLLQVHSRALQLQKRIMQPPANKMAGSDKLRRDLLLVLSRENSSANRLR